MNDPKFSIDEVERAMRMSSLDGSVEAFVLERLSLLEAQVEDLEGYAHSCPTCGEKCVECRCMRDKLAAAERDRDQYVEQVKGLTKAVQLAVEELCDHRPDAASQILQAVLRQTESEAKDAE